MMFLIKIPFAAIVLFIFALIVATGVTTVINYFVYEIPKSNVEIDARWIDAEYCNGHYLNASYLEKRSPPRKASLITIKNRSGKIINKTEIDLSAKTPGFSNDLLNGDNTIYSDKIINHNQQYSACALIISGSAYKGEFYQDDTKEISVKKYKITFD